MRFLPALSLRSRLTLFTGGIALLTAVGSAALANLQVSVWIQAWLLGLLVAMMIALAFVLQRHISEPIVELSTAVRKVTRTGDPSIRVEHRSDDEIGELYSAFNQMLEQLEERERERDAAEHRTREKSQFLAAMSHELRTPLNAIIGFSEILARQLESKIEERQERFLTHIHQSGEHLLAIINDILDLSKVEAGHMEIEPAQIEVSQSIEGVVRIMRATADRRKITTEVLLEPDLPRIWADPIKLKQILYNLISNATKFAPDGSEVRVTARSIRAPEGRDQVEIAVRDRGPGIADDHREQIFQPFFQADDSPGRRYGGTGLGLSLVKSFVELHGGTVDVKTEVNRGSTFIVTLPSWSETVPAWTRATLPGIAVSTHKVLVAAVADVTLARVRLELTSAGYESTPARSLEEALEASAMADHHTLVVEIGLPGNEGWGALSRLANSRENRSIPAVLYLRIGEQYLALGADRLLPASMDSERIARRAAELARSSVRRTAAVHLLASSAEVEQAIEARLVPLGLKLEAFQDPSLGLTRALEDRPDVIVLDLSLRGPEAFEVALQLHARPETANIPIALLLSETPDEKGLVELSRHLDEMVRTSTTRWRSLADTLHRLLSRVPSQDSSRGT